MTDKEKILDEACTKLMEHFDAVQILTTWSDHEQTYDLFWGQGNWYARQGIANTFVQRDKAEENADRIASKMNQDDDSDDWKTTTPEGQP